MRRIRWILLIAAPALLLVLVRAGLGERGARAQHTPAHGDDGATTTVTLPLDENHALRAPAPARRDQPAAETEPAAGDAHDPWALPASDPRRGLVDAFRGMNDDTTPDDAERQYLAALEHSGTSSEAWTDAARTTAQAWFAGLDARLTCFEGGCAAWIKAADAAAFTDARARIAQQSPQAPWAGPVITAPPVTDADGSQRQMWIFVRPE